MFDFSKILDIFGSGNWFRSFTKKPTPADFRRGKTRYGVRISDPNSKHIGKFKGGITPMKQRFKGVSRTAGKQ